MRDLAQRIVPVYKDADTDSFLVNVTALQIVSGAYGAAYDSSRALRRLHRGKPFEGLSQRAALDGIYARARAIEARERLSFAQAYARSFQELVPPLDNAQAAVVMRLLEAPLALYREPVRQAFDRWRAKGSLPQADAVALVRTWLEYESRRSFGVLLPELIAAENRSRYVTGPDVRIPVPGGAVIHARVVRPGRAKGTLPTLLRFTLDPDEDDAQRSAFNGYVGVTAYVRGRTPDGNGRRVAVRARRRRRRGRHRLDRPAAVERRPRRHARRRLLRLHRVGRRARETGGAQGHRHDRADGAGHRLPDGRTDLPQRHGPLGARARGRRDPASRARRGREMARTRRALVPGRSPLLERGRRPAGRLQQADPHLADAPQSRSLLAEVPADGGAVCADRHPGAHHRRLLRSRGGRAVLPSRASSQPTAGRHDAAARPLRRGFDPARHGADAARLHARLRRTRRSARAALPMARPRLQGRDRSLHCCRIASTTR